MRNYLIALEVILVLSTIFEVKGQSTVLVCENGDSSNSIAAELNLEAIHQLNIQLQSIRDILAESSQESKSQQDNVTASFQAVERRSHDQIEGIRQLLNTSLMEIKSQQDNVTASLQAVDRRSQEQIQSIKVFLNDSVQQMQNQLNTAVTSHQAGDRRSQDKIETIYSFLNASLQQIKGQQETVLRKLEAIEQDLSIKNQTQNSWKLELAIFRDVGEVPVLQPIVNDWIVLLNRFDGSLNFNRNWSEYKNGFGDIRRGEFWIGNEKIHRLTNRFACTLRIELHIHGTWYYAEYTNFSIDSESNKYTLRLSGYSGNADDSLTSTSLGSDGCLNRMGFSTRDVDNDRHPDGNCALSYDAGWWFNYCELACLTCSYNATFRWYTLRHLESSGNGRLRAARMMIKSK